MMRTLLAALIVAFSSGHGLAQDLIRSSEGTFSQPNDEIRRHMGSNGKPCLTLESYAKSQVINKDIYEHWITATNSCGQHIKLRVCYHKTDDCIVMTVPPWETKESVLGIYPMVKNFQFDAKEQF